MSASYTYTLNNLGKHGEAFIITTSYTLNALKAKTMYSFIIFSQHLAQCLAYAYLITTFCVSGHLNKRISILHLRKLEVREVPG